MTINRLLSSGSLHSGGLVYLLLGLMEIFFVRTSWRDTFVMSFDFMRLFPLEDYLNLLRDCFIILSFFLLRSGIA
jgi:hypothetical protein